MNIAQLSLKGFITAIISNIIQPVIVLIFALAILYFLWNVALFIKKSDDPKEIEKFKTNAIWGIIAIFVMASMWGLVQVLINSFVPGAGVPSFNSESASPIKGGSFIVPENHPTATFNTSDPNQYTYPIGPNPAGGNYNFNSGYSNYPIYNSSGFQGWTNSTNIGSGVSPRQMPSSAGNYLPQTSTPDTGTPYPH